MTREELVEHMRELVDEALEAREQEHGEEVWSQVERFVLLRTIDSLWVEHLTELDDMRRGIGLRGYAQQDPLNEFRKEAYRLYEELSGLIRRQVATTIFRVTVTREPATVPLPGPGQPARPDGGAAHAADGTGAMADRARDDGHGSGSGGGRGAARRARPRSGPRGPRGRRRRARRPATAPIARPARPTRCAARARCRATRRRPDGVRQGYTPSGARIGRNDPCWCGSGQKYKKCHGA